MSKLKILHVKDHVRMGILIEDFAAKRIAIPNSVEEFNDLLLARSIVDEPSVDDKKNQYEPHWPNGRPSSLDIRPIDDQVMMISLPSAKAIAEGRELAERLSTGGSYPFADGYDVNYQDPARKPGLTDSEWETIYRTRLGDYTIGKCM